jgi:hypothetical protein
MAAFTDLPGEIRNQIYAKYLTVMTDELHGSLPEQFHGEFPIDILTRHVDPLFETKKQIRMEARSLFYRRWLPTFIQTSRGLRFHHFGHLSKFLREVRKRDWCNLHGEICIVRDENNDPAIKRAIRILQVIKIDRLRVDWSANRKVRHTTIGRHRSPVQQGLDRPPYHHLDSSWAGSFIFVRGDLGKYTWLSTLAKCRAKRRRKSSYN